MGFDSAIFQLISGFSGRFFIFDALAIAFAKYLPILLVVLFLFFVFSQEGWKSRLFILVFTGLGVILSRGLITKIIRFIYDKPRPFDIMDLNPLIASNSGLAFPSGHASFLFALAFMIFIFNRKWGWWFIGFSILNGLARIFVGVHWPLDILGGAFVAFLSSGLVYYVLKDQLKRIMNYG